MEQQTPTLTPEQLMEQLRSMPPEELLKLAAEQAAAAGITAAPVPATPPPAAVPEPAELKTGQVSQEQAAATLAQLPQAWIDDEGRTRYGPSPTDQPKPRHTFWISGVTESDEFWELELHCKRQISLPAMEHLQSLTAEQRSGWDGIMHMARAALTQESAAALAVFGDDKRADPTDDRVLDITILAPALRDAYAKVVGVTLPTPDNPDPTKAASGG